MIVVCFEKCSSNAKASHLRPFSCLSPPVVGFEELRRQARSGPSLADQCEEEEVHSGDGGILAIGLINCVN